MKLTSELSNNAVFEALSSEKQERMIAMAVLKKYQQGEFVTLHGDIWPYLLLVHSGEFHAIKESGQGRSLMIESFQAGDMFWGLALFEDNKPNPVTIQSTQSGEIVLWHKSQIEEMISSDPQIAWGLFKLMASKMARANEIVEELAFRPLAGRLALLLLDQTETTEAEVISRNQTLDEMAARVGSTREMVCKVLYRFSDQGILDIQRTEFTIKARQELEEIARKVKG
jgi:CRP-like cAMP-binding protein